MENSDSYYGATYAIVISTFHFCIQDPDVEGLVAKIVKHGGKQRMPIHEYYPREKPYKMCYVEDPFGLILRFIHTAMN